MRPTVAEWRIFWHRYGSGDAVGVELAETETEDAGRCLTLGREVLERSPDGRGQLQRRPVTYGDWRAPTTSEVTGAYRDDLFFAVRWPKGLDLHGGRDGAVRAVGGNSNVVGELLVRDIIFGGWVDVDPAGEAAA